MPAEQAVNKSHVQCLKYTRLFHSGRQLEFNQVVPLCQLSLRMAQAWAVEHEDSSGDLRKYLLLQGRTETEDHLDDIIEACADGEPPPNDALGCSAIGVELFVSRFGIPPMAFPRGRARTEAVHRDDFWPLRVTQWAQQCGAVPWWEFNTPDVRLVIGVLKDSAASVDAVLPAWAQEKKKPSWLQILTMPIGEVLGGLRTGMIGQAMNVASVVLGRCS